MISGSLLVCHTPSRVFHGWYFGGVTNIMTSVDTRVRYEVMGMFTVYSMIFVYRDINFNGFNDRRYRI
ncbi:hypothetical protein HanXRQr2_Chr04g0146551 [Helianthus annuus]|uniref:Uncharacterized protein n=1 Tax=Helianthus annuus TaxID=4232 RepID=A0A9K3J4C8_HELAN|nr:hypothetical protein HanXRQr2_Chr04g0146551 [Helianthus annuus]KAJ0929761.1 hypothetical protein HanPSC8_Chr04g0141341 [Helianthus annuus]